MTHKKRFPWIKWLLLVVLAAGAWYGWRWYKKPGKTPIDYRTAAVTRGDITQSVTANGPLNAVKLVQVGSQVSGIITDLRVDFNSRVTNGQVIAQIDPSTYQQNITQSEAELANAKAAWELAAVNARRAKELVANQLISAAEHDKAVADEHQAEAAVKMREALLKKAKVDLERTTIYSPIDGIVISRVVDVGQTVAASFNAPTLFTIANDLRNMQIEAMVSEADVGGVEEGQQVNFTVEAFPARQFRGEVTQVRFAPVTNQNVVTYTTIVQVNNDDLKLRPGMTANASIVTGQKEGVLRVMNGALRFRPPEGAEVKSNALPQFTRSSNAGQQPSGAKPPAEPPKDQVMASGGPNGTSGELSGQGGGPNRDEMRRRFESMPPEEREQMRARFRDGGGFARSQHRSQDGPITRTVYLLEKEPGKTQAALKPVMIKTGISDGATTEVLEGLKEGDVVVVGVNLPLNATTAAGQRPPSTPFGGPFGGGFRR
jgi:HlyD family secretion protein